MTKIDISHQGFELTKDISSYVEAKVGKLDRYVNRLKRRSIRAEVRLTEEKGRQKDRSTAEIILHMPNHTLTSKESNITIFAAIDIAEAKLTNQLRKIKDKATNRRVRTNKMLDKLGQFTKRRGK